MLRLLMCCWLVGMVMYIVGVTEAADFTLHGGLKNESAYFISGESRWDKVQNRLELKPEAVFAKGWQQIIWDKTDGLRLLDIINPLDMREFILDDFLTQGSACLPRVLRLILCMKN